MGYSITNDSIEYIGTPEELRKDISKRFVERESKSAVQIAKETGVTVKTLYNWADKYVNNHPMKKRKLTAINKMKLLIAYDALKEADKGEFLRTQGLHSEELEMWRMSVLDDSLDIPSEKSLQKLVDSQKEELKRVKKDLARKDKALAETAALLVLKKKLESYFEEDEDDEQL